MGLPTKPTLIADTLRRIYIGVIRQNWHVIPNRQIVELLGWDDRRFAFTLKEDDFLDHKLGPKPDCAELRYHEPTEAERRRASEIRGTLERYFGKTLTMPGEERFAFVRELSKPLDPPRFRDGWMVSGRSTAVNRATARVVARLDGADPRNVRPMVDASLPTGGYRIVTTRDAVSVTAHDESTLITAVRRIPSALATGGEVTGRVAWTPRYLYSYFALYGDPLLEPDLDPFPDGYLDRLSSVGINGVWLQGVLNTLAPSRRFPEFGSGWQTRLANLSRLVERAGRFGIRVFLYLNEPRALTSTFFDKHPTTRGARYQDTWAMCTSAPEVRGWLADSIRHVFREVRGLGGIFTISMSENHTNCFSHGGAWGKPLPKAGDCERCNRRGAVPVMAELMGMFRDAVRAESADAEILHWDWGWPADLSAALIPRLPKDVGLISISEWDQPVRRGGVVTKVGEYSMSVPGPGPRALANWEAARKRGVKAVARASFNNTWEISAVPYIPVPHLVLEHCENLRKSGVEGLMASWTCGGYPSPNLDAAQALYLDSEQPHDSILAEVAAHRFGRGRAQDAVEAWRTFSDAFREFPYGVHIYIMPTQHGPANLLRIRPTGHKPGMILFPHDAYKAWCGAYPPGVARAQFARLAEAWRPGLALIEKAAGVDSLDAAVARTCHNHFQSVANQLEFYILRDRATPDRARMRAILDDEIRLSVRQHRDARLHSEIGYEATNHYYYTPLDLAEKVLNCDLLRREAVL